MRKLILFVASFSLLFLSGCRRHDKEILTSFPLEMENVYTHPTYDHSKITNLFVLPIENTFNSPGVELHRESLTHALVRGLGKFNYFNVQYDPDFEGQISGPVIDLMTGEVDRNTLGKIGKMYHSQAALKVSISDHNPFPPMRLRIKASVVDAETAETVWSFDQVIDTDDVQVVDSMREWWNAFRSGSDEEERFQVSKIRPSFFYNFAFFKFARSYGSTRSQNVETFAEIHGIEEKVKKRSGNRGYRKSPRRIVR